MTTKPHHVTFIDENGDRKQEDYASQRMAQGRADQLKAQGKKRVKLKTETGA